MWLLAYNSFNVDEWWTKNFPDYFGNLNLNDAGSGYTMWKLYNNCPVSTADDTYFSKSWSNILRLTEWSFSMLHTFTNITTGWWTPWVNDGNWMLMRTFLENSPWKYWFWMRIADWWTLYFRTYDSLGNILIELSTTIVNNVMYNIVVTWSVANWFILYQNGNIVDSASYIAPEFGGSNDYIAYYIRKWKLDECKWWNNELTPWEVKNMYMQYKWII